MKANKKKTTTKSRSVFEDNENLDTLTTFSNKIPALTNENNQVILTSDNNNQVLTYSDNNIISTPSNGNNPMLQSIENTSLPSSSNNLHPEVFTSNSILSMSSNYFNGIPTLLDNISSPSSSDESTTLQPSTDNNTTTAPLVNHIVTRPQNKNNSFGRKSTSNVWQYATKSEDGKTATCKICNYTCATISHSTSTIRYHLVRRHNKLDLIITSESVSATKSTISERYKRELHGLCYNAIVIDHRPFNDLRKKGILSIFKKLCPGTVSFQLNN